MELARNWKIHLFALLITVVAEFIGIQRFGLIVFLPLLYALVFGFLISLPKLGILTEAQMSSSADYLNIAIMLLMVKLAINIGPNLGILGQAGWALIFQELGHFLGTILFGLPVALLVGMRREAVGACYSIDREPNIAIILDRYGFDSPEGRGVMGMYIYGTLFGALWISVLSGFVANTHWFHPLALAMGAGVGSTSMMAAATGSIVSVFPAEKDQVLALAAAANLLTTVLGVYFSLFISLPLMVRLYELVTGRRRHEEVDENEQGVA